MKYLAFIFSIYIFALNLVPCADYVLSDDDAKTEISQTVDNNHQHQDSDLCSPFCQCHCCHIHATYFNTAENTLVSNDISTEIFSHFDSLGKEISNPILQPPRV